MEDRNLLSGYIAMFLGEFNLGQDLFLTSGRPLAALEVCVKIIVKFSALSIYASGEKSAGSRDLF